MKITLEILLLNGTKIGDCSSTCDAERKWTEAGRPETWRLRERVYDSEGRLQFELMHELQNLGKPQGEDNGDED